MRPNRYIICVWLFGLFFYLNAQEDTILFGHLDNVTIRADAHPAHRFIYGAIQNRSTNSPKYCDSYHYTCYQKTFVESAHASDSIEKILKNQFLFLSESVSEHFYKKPQYQYEKIIASKTSGIENPIINMLLGHIQTQNIYENDFYKILENNYISPISKTGLREYNYTLKDTLYDGSDSIFVIHFKPKKNSILKLLKGKVWIHSAHYAIQKIEAKPIQSPFAFRLHITQEYEQQNNGTWFPKILTATVHFPEIASKKDTLEAIAHSTIHTHHIEINPELHPRQFGIYNVEEKIGSPKNNLLILDQFRHNKLTDKELKTYTVIDSISKKLKLEKNIILLQSMMMGRVPIGPIDWRFMRTIDYTTIEKWRIGLSIMTNEKLLKFVNFGGYFAYGIKDKKWKWGIETTWKLYEPRELMLHIKYMDDNIETSPITLISRENVNLFYGEYYRHWVIQNFDKSQQLSIKLQMKATKSLSMSIGASYSDNQTLFEYSYRPQKTTQKTFHYQNFQLRASVLFSYHSTVYKIKNLTFYNISPYPSLQLVYERGLKGILSSDYNYNKIIVRVHHRQTYKIGYSEFIIHGGWIDRPLPYSLQFAPMAGYSIIGLNGIEQFATMRANEFLSDRFITLFLRHNFGKMWKGVFSPRIEICQNIGFGWLRNPSDHERVNFQIMNKGFFECGLIIHDIISIKDIISLGFGIFYRYGPYAFAQEKKNFAYNIAISIPFVE